MMLSCIDKKKSGKKNIICLTSMHDRVKVTNYQRLKPQVIVMHDHTKGGVDVVDLISCHHSTRMKSKRWPLRHLLSCWTPSEQTAKQFLKTTRRSSTTLNSHTNWEKPWCCRKSERGLRIQMVCKSQFYRRSDVSLDCLKWIADPSLIWKQLLPQLVAATCVLSQSSAPKHREKLNNKLKAKVLCLFGFHL